MNILLTTVCLFIAIAAHTQNQSVTTHREINTEEKINSAKKGTFQIIFSTENDELVSLNSELLQQIELKRSENEITYLKLSDTAVVRIFPLSEINTPTFIAKNTTLISAEFIKQYNQQ